MVFPPRCDSTSVISRVEAGGGVGMTERVEVDTNFELVDTAPALQNSQGLVIFGHCPIFSSWTLTLFSHMLTFMNLGTVTHALSKWFACCWAEEWGANMVGTAYGHKLCQCRSISPSTLPLLFHYLHWWHHTLLNLICVPNGHRKCLHKAYTALLYWGKSITNCPITQGKLWKFSKPGKIGVTTSCIMKKLLFRLQNLSKVSSDFQ